MMHDWWGWGPGGWGGGMWFGPLFMVLVFVAFIAIVVAIVRWFAGAGSAANRESPHTPSAKDILDQRFARGEIDAADYEARKRALDN